MPAPRAPRARVALLLAAGLLAVGCGENPKLISQDRADALLERVDAIEQAASEGDCSGANAKAFELRARIKALPATVDRRLRENLREWAVHVDERIDKDCTQGQAEPSPTATTSATPTATETPSPTPTATESPSPTATETPATPTATASPEEGDGGTGGTTSP